MEKTKEQKYDELMASLSNARESAKLNMELFKEPMWPEKIDDYKKVIWFRNDVFDAAYAEGYYAAMNYVVNRLIPDLDKPKEQG